MTAVLEPQLCLEAPASLHVEREDITFTTLPDDRVAIQVRVRNRGQLRTLPTTAELQAAPLGAFVAWRPLTVVSVPALDAGEEVVLDAEARRPRPAALGDASRVPPQRLLTALANDDDPDARRRLRAVPVLPADFSDMLGRPNAHWAGNLNIFIGGRAVERHMAQALRVYPGRLNLAMFMVGSGRDAYSFRLKGTAADWEARLECLGRTRAVMDVSHAERVPQKKWFPVRGTAMMLLGLVPPKDCANGSVEVHVRQRSTGQEAVVEFSLDPNAAGPGCYTL